MDADAPADVMLAAEGITKSFDGIRALDGVTFRARTGEINVLVGENGAGKSTLMKILSGAEQPGSGQILYQGAPVAFPSSWDAIRQGIGVIHQELSLMPNLNIAENIFAGREPRRAGLFVDTAAERRRSAALLDRLGQDLSPATLVGGLPVGQQQLVEIAKALAGDLRVLIMDEPTSALSTAEVDVLFQVIRELRQGGLTIIYISHRLEELRQIGDSVTVLRDGHVIASRPLKQASTSWIAEQMVGRELGDLPSRDEAAPGREALRVTGLSASSDAGTPIHDIALSLAVGEIVGIYGLLGAGRTELLEVLAGSRPPSAGEILVGGHPSSAAGVAARLARGVVLVPEDRQRDGVVATLPVRDNILLSSLRQLLRRGLISRPLSNSLAAGQVDALRIKVPSLSAPISALSGGNQQKVLIARALLTEPKVLLLDEPSRGIDVGAKGEIFRIMRDLSRQGMAVLFTSSDLGEVLSVSDRILVMAGGQMSGQFSAVEATEGALARAASTSQVSEVGT